MLKRKNKISFLLVLILTFSHCARVTAPVATPAANQKTTQENNPDSEPSSETPTAESSPDVNQTSSDEQTSQLNKLENELSKISRDDEKKFKDAVKEILIQNNIDSLPKEEIYKQIINVNLRLASETATTYEINKILSENAEYIGDRNVRLVIDYGLFLTSALGGSHISKSLLNKPEKLRLIEEMNNSSVKSFKTALFELFTDVSKNSPYMHYLRRILGKSMSEEELIRYAQHMNEIPGNQALVRDQKRLITQFLEDSKKSSTKQAEKLATRISDDLKKIFFVDVQPEILMREHAAIQHTEEQIKRITRKRGRMSALVGIATVGLAIYTFYKATEHEEYYAEVILTEDNLEAYKTNLAKAERTLKKSYWTIESIQELTGISLSEALDWNEAQDWPFRY